MSLPLELLPQAFLILRTYRIEGIQHKSKVVLRSSIRACISYGTVLGHCVSGIHQDLNSFRVWLIELLLINIY